MRQIEIKEECTLELIIRSSWEMKMRSIQDDEQSSK